MQTFAEWKKQKDSSVKPSTSKVTTAKKTGVTTEVPKENKLDTINKLATLARNIQFGMLPESFQGGLRSASARPLTPIGTLQGMGDIAGGFAGGVPEFAKTLVKFPFNVAAGAVRSLPKVGEVVPSNLPVIGESPNLLETIKGTQQQARETGLPENQAKLFGGGAGLLLAALSVLGAKGLTSMGVSGAKRVKAGLSKPKVAPVTPEQLVPVEELPQTEGVGGLKVGEGAGLEKPVVPPIPPLPTEQGIIPPETRGVIPLGTLKEGKVANNLRQFLMPWTNTITTNLRSMGGGGIEIADRLSSFRREGARLIGTYNQKYVENTKNLTESEKVNFAKSLDGREQPINPKVSQAVEKQRLLDSEVAKDASSVGTETRDDAGRVRPFSPRENFYSHKLNEEGIKDIGTSKGIEVMANEMMNEKLAKGQPTTLAQEIDNIKKYIIPNARGFRSGSIRYVREVDIPEKYLEWNPDKVIPEYGSRAYSDIAYSRQFGAKGELSNQLIDKIRQDGGDYQYAQSRLKEITQGWDAPEARKIMSDTALSVQTVAKLPLAQVANLAQGPINSTAYKGTFRDIIKDVRSAGSKAGREFAVKSGVIDQSLSDIAALTDTTGKSIPSKFARDFLKKTGFTTTERNNRVFAANAGKNLMEREFGNLQQNPNNSLARRHLERLGIDADKALKRGYLTEEEILEGAYEFTKQTQFTANPEDRPFWANSPEGKVVYQFKSFAVGANHFIIEAILKEAKQGNVGPLMVALTLPVIPGAFISSTKNALRGTEDKKGIQRALEVYSSGIGLGIFYDMMVSASYGSGSVFSSMAGPTLSDVGKTWADVIQLKPKNIVKTALPYIPAAMQRTPAAPLAMPSAILLDLIKRRVGK